MTTDNNLTAILRNAPLSNKKINLVAKMIRGKDASQALQFLKFMPTKAAETLYKLVASAVANAHNNSSIPVSGLYIQSIEVGRGKKLKRMRFVGRARIHSYVKHRANVTVVL
jgi:large subunit ribosomal protein L22